MYRVFSFTAALALVAGIAVAQSTQDTDHGATAHAGHDGATADYMAAMENMNTDMAAAMTGDPDVDFMLMMIPHHEGAVEMAKVALDHATDPEVRALAEAVIAAQSEELNMMRAWLAAKGL